MSIFDKARAGLNLNPGQRAFLKLVQGFGLAGVQSLLLALPTVLAVKENQPVLSAVGIGAMIGAFVHGFFAAWQKYSSAKGDAPLAAAIGSVDAAAQQQIQQRFGVPAAKVEPPVVVAPAIAP